METDNIDESMTNKGWTARDVIANVDAEKKFSTYHRNKAEFEKLTAEMAALAKSKVDYVYPTAALRATPNATNTGFFVEMLVKGDTPEDVAVAKQLKPTAWAQRQIAEKCGIPITYFEKMQNTGRWDLLCKNVNGWIADKEKRMLKTIAPDTLRALVSDRFLSIDNYDLLKVVTEACEESGALVQSADVTETKMYLRAINLDKGYPVGEPLTDGSPDYHHIGLIVSNSEVGNGTLVVESFIWRAACRNGMVGSQALQRKHIGERLAVGEFKTDTINATALAVFKQARDIINNTLLSETIVMDWIDRITKAKATNLQSLIPATLNLDEFIVKGSITLGLSETEAKQVRENMFVEDSLTMKEKLSVFGWGNAITQLAHKVEDPDRIIDIQRIGGSLITSSQAELNKIAVKAESVKVR